MLSTAAAIDAELTTSRGRISIPMAARCCTLARLRAVAKTRRPLEWKTFANASPIPPSLQPVIRTLFAIISERLIDAANLEELGL